MPPPWSDLPGLADSSHGRVRLISSSGYLAVTIRCFPLPLGCLLLLLILFTCHFFVYYFLLLTIYFLLLTSYFLLLTSKLIFIIICYPIVWYLPFLILSLLFLIQLLIVTHIALISYSKFIHNWLFWNKSIFIHIEKYSSVLKYLLLIYLNIFPYFSCFRNRTIDREWSSKYR